MKSSLPIQNRIQLLRCGFYDDFVGGGAASIAGMDQLRTSWSRWSRLEPTERTVVNLSGTLGVSKLVGGVFSIVTGEKQTSLRFIRLPSASRGITQKEWIINNFSMPIGCYAIDPSSDLLVVYEDQISTHYRLVVSLQLGRDRGRLIPCLQDSSPRPPRLQREGPSKSGYANYRAPDGRLLLPL